MFPKSSVIRFDFPAHGEMPPVKLFWHDGLKDRAPQVEGVPENEYLGDIPYHITPRPPGTPPLTGFIGGVFDLEKFQAVLADPKHEIPPPDGSVFIGGAVVQWLRDGLG